uniref:Transmembrane protein putative n=1 Tax=Albugo laibachii Nc14 TaxID=890382 RepID=F0W2N6_9STRA|nr:transmembrane protein putative [Albugo laibachii Nc14]|eukprot:CCA15322.1 transmembrane protein putative [Albugo laibachii Nc14]
MHTPPLYYQPNGSSPSRSFESNTTDTPNSSSSEASSRQQFAQSQVDPTSVHILPSINPVSERCTTKPTIDIDAALESSKLPGFLYPATATPSFQLPKTPPMQSTTIPLQETNSAPSSSSNIAPFSGQKANSEPSLTPEYKPKYEFALILSNKVTSPRILARSGLDSTGRQQMEIIQRCIGAGLEVAVMSSTLCSRKFMVLLLRPTPSRLQIEKNRLILERWLQIGAVGQVPSEIEQLIAASDFGSAIPSDTNLSPAERIQTIARIITSTRNASELNPPGADIVIDGENPHDSIISSCFPLHNQRVSASLHAKSTFWWRHSQTLMDDVRYHYGERVAFYFSFVFFYTRSLLFPAIVGTFLYLFCRWYSTVVYMRALCVFGFFIAIVWGTLTLKAWARQTQILRDTWNVRFFKEADYPNASFRPQSFLNIVDARGNLLFREPYYNSLYRIPAYMQTFLVFALFVIGYIIGTTFFVVWYTATMMAPVCSECRECVRLFSCFETRKPTLFTWRWGYILMQGVLLGISLDVLMYVMAVKLLQYLVIRENHATEAQFQRAMTNRLFLINWVSFFLWFMLIAFGMVPFGKDIEAFLATRLHSSHFSVDWENGVIDMSTALVTPLLFTQALNLLMDTAIPSVLKKHKSWASQHFARATRSNPADTLLALAEYHASFEPLAMKLADESLDLQARIELHMMTPIRIPWIEKELGIAIHTVERLENDTCFMTADHVLEESRLEPYNPFPDYLRMVIQFGYVVMFSVVWPFCGLAAFVNNVVHVRNCLVKLLVLRRRPVPRKANSIGQWEKMLMITLILAVFVVAGLICASSGELEVFVSSCAKKRRREFSMTPDFGCLRSSTRFLVALVMEHVALLVVYFLRDSISNTPISIRTSFQRKKELIRRAICGRHDVSIEAVALRELRELYSGVGGDCVLRRGIS